ncbi:MAG: dockerin type I repeat-containing protein [Ruminococcus sp.]|nr:dockerin type I repeat-containing protein [Ruminococcus sp.]
MKLFSVFAAAMTSAALMTALPANAGTTLSVTVPGDVDLNKKFSIADIVKMERYLIGAETFSEQAFVNADLNGDGSADSFDLCLFRKKLTEQYGGFTKVVSDLQGGNEVQQESHEAFISSVDDLYNFFAPLHVVTINGECIEVPTTTEEDIKKYTELYDEEFFKNNVLLLKSEPEPNGGKNNIGDVYYSGDTLNAEFYQTYSGEMNDGYEDKYQLLQVVIPRELHNSKNDKWVYRYPDAEAEVTSEYTRELTSNGWKMAIAGNADKCFISKKAFDKWVSGNFHSAVERYLKKKYDEDFFAKNALVIDLYAQSNENCHITPQIELSPQKITVTYDRETTESFSSDGVYITQAVIPKGACYRAKVETKRSWETKKDFQYKEYDLGMLCETKNKDMIKNYPAEPMWVNSQEQLDGYLNGFLTDEAIEELDLKLNGHTAYIWVDDDIIGSKHQLMTSYKYDAEKKIELTTVTTSPFGDIGGSFLHIIYTSPEDLGDEVYIRDFYVDDNFPKFNTYATEIDVMNDSSTLMVDQYGFGDEYSADLYVTYPGGGPMRYSRFEYIGTIELSQGYRPFSDEYTCTENADGSYTTNGKDFSVTYLDGIFKIKCKTSPDSEYSEYEFNIKNTQ